MRLSLVLTSFGLLLACSSPTRGTAPGRALVVPAVDDDLPNTLAEFALYPDAPDLSVTGSGAFAYEPRFPLWSNGSAKHRLVATPQGDTAPAPDPEELPAGTLFFKTFSFPQGPEHELRPVETRVMRYGLDGWEYYRYLWDGDGKNAVMLTSKRSEYVTVQGVTESFDHEVPSDLDCERCHEASDNPVLGYRQIQLSDTPLDAPDATTEAVMGYVVGNCVHCHNGGNTDANSFDLRPEVFLRNTLNRETEGSASGPGIRIKPGEPERSVLYIALSGGDEEAEIQPMPPLGVQVRDSAAITLLKEWIGGLNEE